MGRKAMTDERRAEIKKRKRDRFVRIAEERTEKVLHDLEVLGNVASKASYDYTEEDLDAILEAVEKGVKRLRERFAGEDRFTLSANRESGL